MLLQKTITNVINDGLSRGADFCEIYAEQTLSNVMELKSSSTNYTSNKDSGVGIRLLYGNEELYTYTNAFDEKSLLQAVKALVAAKKPSGKPTAAGSFTIPFFNKPVEKIKINMEKEKAFLQKLDKKLRAYNSKIFQNTLVLLRKYKQVQIANSEGLFVSDIRPYFRFFVITAAMENNNRAIGHNSFGQTKDLPFLDEEKIVNLSLQAGKQALQNLSASPSPAGKMPVIINKGFGGVIFHEACGHGMETTSVAEGLSVFSDKMGKKIADSCVSAYDDGTLQGEFGFIAVDDEGKKSEKTCLIKEGVLQNYMADRLGSQKTSYKTTGSARRQSYKYPPASRMRNTYIASGNSSLEEMIKDVDYGLFAESMGGGSVIPGTGNYNFSVTSACLIRNGRLAEPVKGASLVGNGLDTLSKITKVGKDMELAPGMCGSISGLVPVTVGQPAILVSEITVGGTDVKK